MASKKCWSNVTPEFFYIHVQWQAPTDRQNAFLCLGKFIDGVPTSGPQGHKFVSDSIKETPNNGKFVCCFFFFFFNERGLFYVIQDLKDIPRNLC